MLKEHDYSQTPVMDNGGLKGILTEKNLLHHAIKGTAGQEKIEELVDLDFCVVHSDTELYVLTDCSVVFRQHLSIILREKQRISLHGDLIDHMARGSARRFSE